MKVGPLALLVLAGCPSDEENPRVLWLGLDGRETEVILLEDQPAEF